MSDDDEWDRWSKAWLGERRGVPPVLTRARTDRVRARAEVVLVGALHVAVGGVGLWLAQHALTTGDRFAAILLLVVAATGVVPLWLLRGFWARRGGSPDQLLDDLEQRTLVRRRVGLARAGVATLVVGGVSGAWVLVVLQKGLPFAVYSHNLGLVVCAVVVAGVAFWLSDRRCVAVLEEVRQARALLSSAEGEKS